MVFDGLLKIVKFIENIEAGNINLREPTAVIRVMSEFMSVSAEVTDQEGFVFLEVINLK